MKPHIRLTFILIAFLACVGCAALCVFGPAVQIVPPVLTAVSVCATLFGTFYNIKKSDKNVAVRTVGVILALVFAFICVGSIMFALYRAGESAACTLTFLKI